MMCVIFLIYIPLIILDILSTTGIVLIKLVK